MDFGERFLIDVVLDQENSDPWGSSVRFDTWKLAVERELMKIAGSKAGMALLTSLRNKGKFRAILPPSLTMVSPQNKLVLNCGSSNFSFAVPVDVAVPSRGRTYIAEVHFDPSGYMSGSVCYRRRHRGSFAFNRGALPDEVLFHELFHSLRGSEAAGNFGLNGGLSGYDDREEFLAVVVTNIYISDYTNGHRSGLRGAHFNHSPLDANLSRSLTFFKSSPQVLPLMRAFVTTPSMRRLCEALCSVKASFKPVAAVMDRSLAPLLEKLSQSDQSIKREAWMPFVTGAARLTEPGPPAPDFAAGMKGLGEELAREALSVLSR